MAKLIPEKFPAKQGPDRRGEWALLVEEFMESGSESSRVDLGGEVSPMRYKSVYGCLNQAIRSRKLYPRHVKVASRQEKIYLVRQDHD